MTHRRCCCCPCPLFGFDPGVEPSPPVLTEDMSAFRLAYDRTGDGVAFTVEPIAANCSATQTLTTASQSTKDIKTGNFIDYHTGASISGSRRWTLHVSAASDSWIAGMILWEPSGFSWDPSQRGSIAGVTAQGMLRWFDKRNVLRPDANDTPVLMVGPVIEQGGTRFYTTQQMLFGPSKDALCSGGAVEYDHVMPPADECWRQIGFNGRDGVSPHWVGRHPYFTEMGCFWPPDKLGSGNRMLGRADDWFHTLDLATLESDLDDRPDLSYDVVSRPVTRFGWWIALSSRHPDLYADTGFLSPGASASEFEFDVLIDDIWLEVGGWGIRKLVGSDNGISRSLTTIIDEPLDTIPSGWTQQLGLQRHPGILEPSWDGANHNNSFEILNDRLTLRENVESFGQYGTGACFTRITPPGPQGPNDAPHSEDFELVIDFTWWQLRNRDHCCNLGDTLGGGCEDVHENRHLFCGVHFATFARFYLGRYAAPSVNGYMDTSKPCGVIGYFANSPVLDDGPYVASWSYAPEWNYPYNGPYAFAPRQATALPNGGACGTTQWGYTTPMDGDRVSVILRRHYTDAEAAALIEQRDQLWALHGSNPGYKLPFEVIDPYNMMDLYVQIHGRTLRQDGSSRSSFLTKFLPTLSTTAQWPVGVVAYSGCHVSDFRVRVHW